MVLAAQLSAPEPRKMWFNADDVPVNKLAPESAATVLIRITIRPDGTLKSCDVEESSANRELDEYTCDLTRKRARFKPARWTDGSPVYGVYRIPVVWTVFDRSSPKLRKAPDVVLTVDQLPRGVRAPASVRLMFAVDDKGQPSSCMAEPSEGIPDPNLALVPLACAQLLKGYRAIPPKDDAGMPIRSVQDGSVLFIKE